MSNMRNLGFNTSSPEISGGDGLARNEMLARSNEIHMAAASSRATKTNDTDAIEALPTPAPTLVEQPTQPSPFYQQETRQFVAAEQPLTIDSALQAVERAREWGEAAE